MKYSALPMLALVASLAGCGRAPIPRDSFRLTVSDLFVDEAQRVSLIHIQSSDTNGYSVSYAAARHQGSVWGAFPKATNGLTEGRVWIAASRVAVEDADHDLVQTILRGGGEETTVREVAKGTPLTNSVAITIRDGTYALEKPLVIGRMDRADITLRVGKTAKTAGER